MAPMSSKFALFFLALLISPIFAAWQMFADKSDTYLYNTITGEVFIKKKTSDGRYFFVKMPPGILQEDFNRLERKDGFDSSFQLNPLKPLKPDSKNADSKNADSKNEAIKKAQQMILDAIGGNSDNK